MKFVPIDLINEYDILGENIYNTDGDILALKGTRVNKKILERLKCWNYSALPVEINPFKECTTKIIESRIKDKAIYAVNNLFNICHEWNNSSDFITKKFMQDKMNSTIKELENIVHEVVDNILNKNNVMINLEDIKKSDNYTFEHCINTSIFSMVLGIGYGLNKNQLYDLTLGTMLHDIGKIFVPPSILNKNGKLTKDEFNIIKKHTTKGYEIIKEIDGISKNASLICLQHHERVDGHGYPHGLNGANIDVLSRLAAVADVYDALVSDRPYRKALPPKEATEYIMASGEQHFSMDIVKVFVNKIIPFPINSVVKLSNDNIGIVEAFNPNLPLRPIIKIVKEKEKHVNPYICNLLDDMSIVIEELI